MRNIILWTVICGFFTNPSVLPGQLCTFLVSPDGTPSQALYVDHDGRIGIGTTAPSAQIALMNVGPFDGLKLLSFGEADLDEFFFQGNFSGSGAAGNSLILSSYWTSPILFFGGDGRIGVGTASPSTRLDVAGAIAVNGVEVVDSVGRFVGDTTNLEAVPHGVASGELIGEYPSPEIDPSAVVHSLNTVQGDVVLSGGVPGDGIAVGVNGNVVTISIDGRIGRDLELERDLNIGTNGSGNRQVTVGHSGGGQIILETYDQGDSWLELKGGEAEEAGVVIVADDDGRGTIGTDEIQIRDLVELKPRVHPPTNPKVGTVYYDSDGAFCVFNGEGWDRVGSGNCG